MILHKPWMRVVVFTIVATLLLTPLDYLQVIFGVRTAGTDPYFTPLKFALVGFLLGLLSYKLDPKPVSSRSVYSIIFATSFAAGYIATTDIKDPTCLTIIFLFIIFCQSLLAWLMEISWKEILPFFLLMAIVGPLAEYIDIRFGGFTYIGWTSIPYWLPLLWGSGSFLVRSLTGEEK